MSDNIPFDIQMEIIKKVSNVKSLIRFRSVSKPWRSFIDSSDFIKGYGARHTQPHSFILRYKLDYLDIGCLDLDLRYICLVDDDNETFKVQQQELVPSVMSPFLKHYSVSGFVGTCHGLLCLYGYTKVDHKRVVVIWNPSIGKSFGIAVPSFCSQSPAYTWNQLVFGFGVCPVTRDPTVVNIFQTPNKPRHVEVFTLSSGVWNVIPSGNLPPQSITLISSTQVVIDRFIYWGGWEKTSNDDGESTTHQTVVSFDLITKEFKVVDLPDSLTNKVFSHVSVSKLRESLVVSGKIMAEDGVRCGVWVMEHDSSFRKLFTTRARARVPLGKILWFKKNGEPIFETSKEVGVSTLDVYDPCSQRIKNLGFSKVEDSFFMGPYKESLLLLDHSDLHIYSNNN